MSETLVNEILEFLRKHKVKPDQKLSVIVNQGPGSFSRIRIALAIAKGLEISNKVRLFGFKNTWFFYMLAFRPHRYTFWANFTCIWDYLVRICA